MTNPTLEEQITNLRLQRKKAQATLAYETKLFKLISGLKTKISFRYTKALKNYQRLDLQLAELDGRLKLTKPKTSAKKSPVATTGQDLAKIIKNLKPGELNDFINHLEKEKAKHEKTTSGE